MPGSARIVVPNIPHHITQRGNNRQAVFFDEEDYRRYLEVLDKQSKKAGLELLGFCLMTNHTYLIAVPPSTESLAVALGRAHGEYARCINRKLDRSGHLWQNRFYSCALDEKHLWRALRYVERNPVRARMVDQACDYVWSSARHHGRVGESTGTLNLTLWQEVWNLSSWNAFLNEQDNDRDLYCLRSHSRTGRPWFSTGGQSPGTVTSGM